MNLKKTGYVLLLVAAAALGYCLHPAAEVSKDEPEQSVAKRPVPGASDRGDAAKVGALRLKVKNLEAQLADVRENKEIAVSNAVAQAMAQRPNRPRGPGRERLEELKKRDPARFAQVTNRLAKMHQERKNRQTARATFLASVNTSHMSAQGKETHDEYQELLIRREALEEQIHQPDVTEDMRHELMGELREVDHQMRTLGESERQVLLGEVAQAMGMEGDAASELVQTVSDIFDATESGGGPPGPPPMGNLP